MNILCRLGIHQADKYRYITVRKQKGRHKWHKNYMVCRICGKLLSPLSVNKRRRFDGKEDDGK